MSIKSLLVLAISVLMVAFFIGCAKAPQAAVDAANAALSAAKAAEADRYLAQEYNAAQDSVNAAMTEIETQNSKFALTRNYNKAKALLESATKIATEIKDKVTGKKEEVKVEAQKLITDLQTALVDAKKLLKKAPRGKEGRAALEVMQGELKAVETSIPEATTLINNGDFLSARDKINAGLQKVNSIIDELKQAIAKRAGK